MNRIADASQVVGEMSAATSAILEEIAAVVIGRNEGSRLIDCLTSLQSNVKCMVYVDSGSSDGSAQVAERLGPTLSA